MVVYVKLANNKWLSYAKNSDHNTYLNNFILIIIGWTYCWCRECSRVVLGIEFHHLANDDPYKVALKETIVMARQQLASYTICHVFHILDWLLVNQWSHPTLVAMMRGEDVDRDCGLFVNPFIIATPLCLFMQRKCRWMCNMISSTNDSLRLICTILKLDLQCQWYVQWYSQKFSTVCASICSIPFYPTLLSCAIKLVLQ